MYGKLENAYYACIHGGCMGGITEIRVREETRSELDELRGDGEDYDDVLWELLEAVDRGAETDD